MSMQHSNASPLILSLGIVVSPLLCWISIVTPQDLLHKLSSVRDAFHKGLLWLAFFSMNLSPRLAKQPLFSDERT